MVVRRGKTLANNHSQTKMYCYRRQAMAMNGCSVLHMIESNGETFKMLQVVGKVTKRPIDMVEVGQ